jgi:glycosyltransferase involved in cell wall biosynthesis
VLGALERVVARRADVTLGASSDLVERARVLGALDARLAPVAAPALPPARRTRAEVRAELGAGDRPLLLAVGRIAAQKGYDTLLDAMALALDATALARTPAPLVMIAGDGDPALTEELHRRVRAERLPVVLLGHRDDVADLLAAADVVVLPSRWEARALVVQEALRAGVPVVATAVGGVPELVGDAAVLVPPSDPGALAAAVGALLADADLRAELAAAGLRQAATWPEEADTVAQTLDVYRQVTFRR